MQYKNQPHVYLADLLDDLDVWQLTSLLNWLSCQGFKTSRGNIKAWRKANNLPVREE